MGSTRILIRQVFFRGKRVSASREAEGRWKRPPPGRKEDKKDKFSRGEKRVLVRLEKKSSAHTTEKKEK